MRSRILAVGLAAALVAAAGAGAAATPAEDAARRGAAYIAERQEPSGTFFSPDTTSDITAEALVALVAGGVEGDAIDDALGFIREHGPDRARGDAGWAGRIAMGIAAGEGNPRAFGGVDYAELIGEHYDASTGRYDGNIYANSLALLGLAASGVDPPEDAIRYVRANQCAGGGFAWASGCAGIPDVDTTAHTVSALLALGLGTDDLTVSRARDWLVGARNDEGGFGYASGEPTNANSTGLALSAVAALGEDPADAPWADEDGDPLSALLALQTPSGGFRYLASQDDPNDYTTVQAVPGAAGVRYPLLPQAPPTPTARSTDRPGSTHDEQERVPTGSESRDTPSPTERRRARAPAEATPTPSPKRAELHGSGEHRAGVVVRGEDGEVRRMCVLFDEPELSGLALLQRTGLDVVTEGFSQGGAAICRIGPDGCSSGDCFCDYPTFWGYWTREGGGEAWAFSEVGAADRSVTDGAMDGWVWGPDGEPPPPDLTIDDVCPPADEASRATRGATSTPEPGPEGGGLNTLALGGVGVLLLGSGAALGVHRWRTR